MSAYRVELRASPDTPTEEAHAKKQGKVLGSQTVIYPCIYADSPERAVLRAVELESSFLYREQIWLFCEPILVEEHLSGKSVEPLLKLVFERNTI